MRKYKKLIKLLVSSVVFLGSVLWRTARRVAGFANRLDCIVLYYHAIPAQDRRRFAEQMNTLLRISTPIPACSDALLDPYVRYSAITFDDGFESVFTDAVPELLKRQIPATVFVTVGKLGDCASWWPEHAPERSQTIMTAEQLRSLPDLITVGSHTLTHPVLSRIEGAEAVYELRASKARLEAIMEQEISLFSFPYGAYTSTLIEGCREVGYKRVFTSLPVRAFTTAGQFVVGRVDVHPSDSQWEFRLKVLGAYCWVPFASRLKRHCIDIISGCYRLQKNQTPHIAN